MRWGLPPPAPSESRGRPRHPSTPPAHAPTASVCALQLEMGSAPVAQLRDALRCALLVLPLPKAEHTVLLRYLGALSRTGRATWASQLRELPMPSGLAAVPQSTKAGHTSVATDSEHEVCLGPGMHWLGRHLRGGPGSGWLGRRLEEVAKSGWGRLLSVTNAIAAGTCRQGDSGWA